MAEAIYKLQPNRTMHLRGFDRRGAAAAMHSATESGFTVSGVFRDMADFCVLMLWNADDFFGHPRWRYLPDFDFSGVVLQFDVTYTNLQPLDSPKYSWIDWADLDVIRADGSTWRGRLIDVAQQVGGEYTAASGRFTLVDNGLQEYDRVTIWYQNIAFDHIVAAGQTAVDVLESIRDQINFFNWSMWGVLIPLTARVEGSDLVIEAERAGYDGNMITLYAQAKNENLYFTPGVLKLSGGASDATWRVTLDFSLLGLTQVRKMWFTYAPRLADSAEYHEAEWAAVYTNWTVTGANRALKVAGPGSVRVDCRDRWAAYSGESWSDEIGWYWLGFARRANVAGDVVTVTYHCDHIHDLYVGTSLYVDRGKFAVSLDDDSPTTLDMYLAEEPAVNSRRRVRSGVPPGRHVLRLEVSGAGYCYFDYLEAAVPSDVPDAEVVYTDRNAATDWDTDHTYKLPPARLVRQIKWSGLHGDVNHYVGVFWWGERERTGNYYVPEWRVTFGGTWDAGSGFGDGDQVFVDISGTIMGKTVFPGDDSASIAAHFAYFANAIFIGVWASVEDTTVIFRCRTPVWGFTTGTSTTSSTGTISEDGSLSGGVEGVWRIAPYRVPVLNRAARDWHADFFAQVAACGWTATAAFSMELIDPPEDWAARYEDGTAVLTDTGFGQMHSTHCAFLAGWLPEYQSAAYREIAALMVAAGLTPWLQYGEFLWWFFAGGSPASMAYYDDSTVAAARALLGRALHVFTSPADDPSVNGYADANFLRGRVKAHIDTLRAAVLAEYPGARFELLWPLDVNEPDIEPLNRYVNLPVEYEQKSGSGLDRLKMEALASGRVERNVGKARRAMRYPFSELRWAREDVRYLMPWYDPGCPWREESLSAVTERLPLTLWAWDHLGLFGWPLPLPAAVRRSALAA